MATNVQTSGTAFEPQGKYIQISDPYMSRWGEKPGKPTGQRGRKSRAAVPPESFRGHPAVSHSARWNKPPNFIPFSDRRLTRALSDFNTKRFEVPSSPRRPAGSVAVNASVLASSCLIYRCGRHFQTLHRGEEYY